MSRSRRFTAVLAAGFFAFNGAWPSWAEDKAPQAAGDFLAEPQSSQLPVIPELRSDEPVTVTNEGLPSVTGVVPAEAADDRVEATDVSNADQILSPATLSSPEIAKVTGAVDKAARGDDRALDAIYTNAASDEFNPERLSTFLGGQDVIRIAVPTAPGHGHQAVGATIAKRVRELGFKGRYEMIYSDSVKYKLGVTMRGFNPEGPDIQEVPQLGATFISHSAFEKARPRPVGLGISAADGWMLGYLGAAIHASIEPFKWWAPAMEVPGRRQKLEEFESLPLHYSIPNPSDVSGFIAGEMSDSEEHRAKIDGLQALASALGIVDLLPAYGLSKIGLNKVSGFLNAVALAQDRAPEMLKKGIVAVFFCDHHGEALPWLGENLNKAAGRPRFKTISILDPEASRTLSNIQKREILLLRVGSVAQNVFEYLFSRQTLPATVEGANGENLMRLLGLPYVNLTGGLFGYGDLIMRASDKGVSLNLLNVIASLTADHITPELIADFIISAANPESGISRAFRDARPTSLSEDKVARVLDRAIAAYYQSSTPKGR